jgi:hypothetical protein
VADEVQTRRASGYFLTKPVAGNDRSMDSSLLPGPLISLSTCLAESAFEYWWSAENVESATGFGVPAGRLPELVTWYRDRFGVEFGAPNVAFTLAVVHEFIEQFVEDPADLVVLGCALAADQADRLLQHPAAPDQGEYGVYEAIRGDMPLDEGGEVLGYEVLSYEYGIEHSWLCGGLERDAREVLGISPGSWGLIAGESDARAVAAYANRDDVPTEPGTWFPWLVVRYPVEPANA